MIDWLVANKEWLFSGGGVALCASVVAVFRHFRKPLVTKTQSVEVNVENFVYAKPTDIALAEISNFQRISNVLPEQIQNSIYHAPPLQRKAVAERYIGIRVEWNTELFSAESHGDTVRLYLRTKSSDNSPSSIIVICKVNLADYPELNVLPPKSNIRVIGSIIEVSTLLVVTLNDSVLIFHSQDPGWL